MMRAFSVGNAPPPVARTRHDGLVLADEFSNAWIASSVTWSSVSPKSMYAPVYAPFGGTGSGGAAEAKAKCKMQKAKVQRKVPR